MSGRSMMPCPGGPLSFAVSRRVETDPEAGIALDHLSPPSHRRGERAPVTSRRPFRNVA